MPAFIDITGWIENHMWQSTSTYPGAIISECPQPPEIPDDYRVYCQKFEIGSQSGTYIETKAHVDPAATPVADRPIADFIMPAVILRTPQPKADGEPITVDDLTATAVEIPADACLIVAAGWDRHWHDAERFVNGSPYLTRAAGEWLLAKSPRCLAGDMPCFDCRSAPCFPWQAFWATVPYLLAPVVNVYRQEITHGRLFALPLKIRGAMGTPVRAVLEMDSGH